jgi:hypothetical protein
VFRKGRTLEARAAELLERRWPRRRRWLSVVEGPDAGRELSLGPSTVRIGTAPGLQLRLSDPGRELGA